MGIYSKQRPIAYQFNSNNAMPLLDETGPEGKGPRTGLGLGECEKEGAREFDQQEIPRWPRRWFGRFGRGTGARWSDRVGRGWRWR